MVRGLFELYVVKNGPWMVDGWRGEIYKNMNGEVTGADIQSVSSSIDPYVSLFVFTERAVAQDVADAIGGTVVVFIRDGLD